MLAFYLSLACVRETYGYISEQTLGVNGNCSRFFNGKLEEGCDSFLPRGIIKYVGEVVCCIVSYDSKADVNSFRMTPLRILFIRTI